MYRGSLPAGTTGLSYPYPILQIVMVGDVKTIRFVHDRSQYVYWYDETADEIKSSYYGFSGAAVLSHNIGLQCGLDLPGSAVANYIVNSKEDVTWRLDPLP